MWANNETGTIFPVEGLAEMAKEHGALFHTDAVQAVGKVPIALKDSPIDMLSLSGHKLHAPKGIGALYVKRGARFKPLLRGGHQERGPPRRHREHAGIVALGKAAELVAAYGGRADPRAGAARSAGRGRSAARSRIASSTAINTTGCRTPAISPSNMSRAKRSCCI